MLRNNQPKARGSSNVPCGDSGNSAMVKYLPSFRTDPRELMPPPTEYWEQDATSKLSTSSPVLLHDALKHEIPDVPLSSFPRLHTTPPRDRIFAK